METWKEHVSGIDRLFVEIWASFNFVLWKKKYKIGKDKYQASKEDSINRLADFIQKHSDDPKPDINYCLEQARLIWERLDKEKV